MKLVWMLPHRYKSAATNLVTPIICPNAIAQTNICCVCNLWQLSAAPKGRVPTKNTENVSRYLPSNYFFLITTVSPHPLSKES